MHVAHRLLAPALRRPPRAPRAARFADRVGIAPARFAAATRRSRRRRRRPTSCHRARRRGRAPECRSARSPDRRASSPLSVIASATDDDAGKAQPLAVGDGARIRLDQQRRRPCRAARPAPRRSMPGLPAQAAPDRRCGTARPPGTPQRARERGVLGRCSASPCTGMTIFGLTQPIISSSSARRGWPDTCTRCVRSVITSMPWSISPLMTRPTAFSLPGMVRAEKITRSPARASPPDARPRRCATSAARGSPWLPVQSATTLSGGR